MLSCCWKGVANAQLRVVDYNTGGVVQPSLQQVLVAIGDTPIDGLAQPIDLLVLQEQSSTSTTTQDIVDLLNDAYGAGSYARGNVNGGTLGAGRPGVVYRTASLELLEEHAFGELGSTAQARQTLRYRLRPVGYSASADFYVYANHYKAGTGTSNANRRLAEANALRADSDALGEGTHAIYAGDFNIRSSSEAMYQALLAEGPGQSFDPLDAPGTWHDSAAFLELHSQSPVTSSRFPGQITGGMDDRFDFQLVTDEFLDDKGLAYVANTYHVFGNNGTHNLNGEITSGSGASPDLLDALASASDHLPVVAEYQLPAVMSVELLPIPARVILNASTTMEVSVANGAPVLDPRGADELDYSGQLQGSVTDSFSGTAAALAPANQHLFPLNTSLTGSFEVQLDVESSSQSVAQGTFSSAIAYEVLAHSTASWSNEGVENVLDVDFAVVPLATGSYTRSLEIHNLPADGAMTAALDLDDVAETGDTSVISTTLQPFLGLTAGESQPFEVELLSEELGAFQFEIEATVSDEDLPGASPGDQLTIQVTGQVAQAGDANLDGLVTASIDGAIVLNNLSTPQGNKTWQDGDFDLDRNVFASTDGALLLTNLSHQPVAVVPEPCAAVLLLGALCQLGFLAARAPGRQTANQRHQVTRFTRG